MDGHNIARPEILIDVAVSVGLPRDDAETVIRDRSWSDAIDADWSRARQFGVTGVPTFVANRHASVGAQPYEILEQLLVQSGAIKRNR